MIQHPRTRIAVSAFAIVALMLLTGCSDSQEKGQDDMIDVMDEYADVLESIKDEDSAKAAKDEFAELAEELKEILARMEKLEKPSKEEQAALQKESDAKMKPIEERIQKEMKRIASDPKLMALAMEAIGGFAATGLMGR